MISSWRAHNVEMTKKMKKALRSLLPFTEPVIGSEEAVVDVFCNFIDDGGG
jgi:hypothetical protein